MTVLAPSAYKAAERMRDLREVELRQRGMRQVGDCAHEAVRDSHPEDRATVSFGRSPRERGESATKSKCPSCGHKAHGPGGCMAFAKNKFCRC
jgi:hypothetical protein